jgi:hypothetical protein
MFFRRPAVKEPTFDDRLQALRDAGFDVERQADGSYRVRRGQIAARIADVPGSRPHIERAGWIFGNAIGALVDAGFQKFWHVDGRRQAPALAAQLQKLHQFEEDLREALALDSLYNTSLGTTNDLHPYDRVLGRDHGGVRRPWERPN